MQLLYKKLNKILTYFIRLEKIPRNLTTIAKQLFKMAVCIKPRIIQNGLEIFKRHNDSQDVISEMESLANGGMFIAKIGSTYWLVLFAWIIFSLGFCSSQFIHVYMIFKLQVLQVI